MIAPTHTNPPLQSQTSLMPNTAPLPGQSQPAPTSIQLNNSNIDAAKIFVGGLSWQTTEETLRYHFEQYGDVLSVEIMKDRNTGDPRGFAFVVFRSDDTVQLILNEKPHEIDRKIVDVKRAQARGFAPPSIHPNHPQHQQQQQHQNHHGNTGMNHFITNNTNPNASSTNATQVNSNATNSGNNKNDTQSYEINKVFVGGLPLHFTREDLNQHLAPYGTIVDSIVMMDAINRTRSRGFGFVTFASSEFANECIKHQPINMNGKMVEVKLAMPRGTHNNSQNHNNHFNNNDGGYHGNPLHMNNATTNSNTNNSNLPTHLLNKKKLNQPLSLPTLSSLSVNKGKYAGLAASYGKNGWRAGYGTNAFGKMGWNVEGWEDYNVTEGDDDKDGVAEKCGFSFGLLNKMDEDEEENRDGGEEDGTGHKSKRTKY